ncbi:hypothetical protein J14TS2_49290 [Bacillus sp. J14TS2]|uniref:extracellular solute-binding protein n=1 Tax=Bacillus sp. J14TS2 TaxID=2807188 RepID=UPI001B1FBD8E|nr:extracellular solute-binding protein [Bacillus sp. J14TS2]GIN74454.1 hypothetical protein J14TS2_49290 [Bacillus sp. J14TS2]
MSKPTFKDIARVAGVSHGTVSNVLNGKGNVSVKKIQMVEAAAKKLGYKINYTAKTLRSGSTNAVAIILPSIKLEEYALMYEGLDKTLTKLGYRTHLYSTYDLQHNENLILKEIAAERMTGVVTVSCLDDATSYYQELDIVKEHIVFVNRRVAHAEKFIGFDFDLAGKEISDYLKTKEYHSIGIFSDQIRFSNEKQFVDRLKEGLCEQKQVKIIHSTLNQTYSKVFDFFQERPFDIIVTTSLSKGNILKKAYLWGSTQKMPKILCLAPTQLNFDESIEFYQLNFHFFGSKIAELLINQVNGKEDINPTSLFKNNGLNKFGDYLDRELYKSTLNFLTIPSPTTDAMSKIIPYFKKKTGIEIKLTIKPYEEIYKTLSDPEKYNHYDIIRMDMAWLSWFGKDVFSPLNGIDQNFDQILNGYPTYIKRNYSEIDKVAYALPFDSSVQMLFYRKDLFEDQKIKRIYFEKYKRDLLPPKDFSAFNEMLSFYTSSYFENTSIKYGTSVILGRSEIMAAEFLTRYYAEKGTLINKQGQICLDPTIAKRALQNYIETVNLSQKLDTNWWGEAVTSFANGETAMTIGFANHVSRIAHSDIGSLIGYAAVPGNKPLLGGGVVGITKQSKNKRAAINFLNWINEIETAEQITLLGGTSSNQMVYENQTIRMLYPWLEGMNEANDDGIRDTKDKTGRRLNTRSIEQIIGKAIHEVLVGNVDIDKGIQQLNRQLLDAQGTLIKV